MIRWILLLSVLLVSVGVHAADSGTISSNTPLYDQPGGQATGTLLANTLVEIQERRDGWYRVTATGGRQGWVRIGSVRLAGQRQSESVFSGLLGWLNSGRSVQSGGTATAGIRGLDAGDIEAAQPDHAAVQRMDSFAVSPEAARQYANALPLQSRSVPALK
jgi:hypothetical protein